jgi:Flp pilus assembly protein TadD
MKASLLAVGLLAIGCSKPAARALPDAGVDAAPVTVVDAGGPPSAAARAAALKDLDEGRKLARAKEWAKALSAFDRALAVMPDDARVLSEVGWAAFQANQLDRAEHANARALANAKEPLVRAPILYNMGRVAEGAGDRTRRERRIARRSRSATTRR